MEPKSDTLHKLFISRIDIDKFVVRDASGIHIFSFQLEVLEMKSTERYLFQYWRNR